MKISAVFAAVLLLFPSAAATAGDGLNVLNVKAAVDAGFVKETPDWKEAVQNAFQKADQEFNRQFGIRIVLKEITEWKSAAEGENLGQNPLKRLLYGYLMKEIPLGGNDAAVGFTGRTDGFSVDGGADWNGNYALVTVLSLDLAHTLVHELGHLCGADDTELLDSVMHKGGWKTSFNFDETNKKIISESRCRKK